MYSVKWKFHIKIDELKRKTPVIILLGWLTPHCLCYNSCVFILTHLFRKYFRDFFSFPLLWLICGWRSGNLSLHLQPMGSKNKTKQVIVRTNFPRVRPRPARDESVIQAITGACPFLRQTTVITLVSLFITNLGCNFDDPLFFATKQSYRWR